MQQQQSGDEDSFAYNNTLRRSIFDAYSGIFNGMSREKVNIYMPQYVPVSFSCYSGRCLPDFTARHSVYWIAMIVLALRA